MDNDASVEMVDGNRRRAGLARSTRKAGLDQSFRWTPDVPGSGS